MITCYFDRHGETPAGGAKRRNLPRIELVNNTFEADDRKQSGTEAREPRQSEHEKRDQTFPSAAI